MFTGIIDYLGTIEKLEYFPNSMRVWIKSHFSDLVLGESIAIDGMCLTVAEINQTIFECDISPETVKVTTAKNFKMNQFVNLERALLVSSRLGGHIVSGHVDQTCILKTIQKHQEFTEMIFKDIHEDNMKFLVKKGSIAINGVSLTMNEVKNNSFSVMLIPHTLQRTNLSLLSIGDRVNIEFDMVARIILNQLQKYS